MAVLINFKICDNAPECGGISVCPTGALTFDNSNNTIVIDNDKCISCGACEKECPIGAIRVSKTDDEFNKIQKEINDDTRTIKDLFVDRYGAIPLSDFFIIDHAEIESKIQNDNITLIELYTDESIQCLLKSIPIKDLTKNMPKDTLFYKANATEQVLEKYNIKELPALLVFNKSNLSGHIDGYYTIDEKDSLISQINSML